MSGTNSPASPEYGPNAFPATSDDQELTLFRRTAVALVVGGTLSLFLIVGFSLLVKIGEGGLLQAVIVRAFSVTGFLFSALALVAGVGLMGKRRWSGPTAVLSSWLLVLSCACLLACFLTVTVHNVRDFSRESQMDTATGSEYWTMILLAVAIGFGQPAAALAWPLWLAFKAIAYFRSAKVKRICAGPPGTQKRYAVPFFDCV